MLSIVQSIIARRQTDERTARIAGLTGVVVGLVGIFTFPLLKTQDPMYGRYFLYLSAVLLAEFATLWGGLLLVWGTSTLSTARWRSLTSVRALAVPAAAAVPWILAAFVPTPKIDPARPPVPPTMTLPDVVRGTIAPPGGALIGAGFLVVIGVAVARDERKWAGIAGTFLVALAVIGGLTARSFLNGFGKVLIGAIVVGVIAVPFGYVTADRETADA